MSQELTYETIEAMKLEPGDLVVVKRDEGSLPIVLEGFMGGLARAFPDNTFAILPPGMNLEKMEAKDLKDLIENVDEPRTPAMAYKIKSNGRCLDTKVIGPDGKMLGGVQAMSIEASAGQALIQVELLQIQTDEDGKVVRLEPQMVALNMEIPAEQVKVVTEPLPAEDERGNQVPDQKKD